MVLIIIIKIMTIIIKPCIVLSVHSKKQERALNQCMSLHSTIIYLFYFILFFNQLESNLQGENSTF